jgi:hypothetical protein
MQTVTIQKAIAFKTNEHSETPEAVKLTFTPETLHRIATIQSLIIQYKLYSVKIEIPDTFTLLNIGEEDDEEESGWRSEDGTFIIYEERFYFYAQNKWSADDQIESDEMDVIEIMNLFPIGEQTQPKPLPELVEGKSTCFLFGDEACAIYSEDGIEALTEYIERGEGYALYEFTGDAIDLISNYTGWGDYIILNKTEYQTLSNL